MSELPARRVFVTRPIPAAGLELLAAAGAEVAVCPESLDGPQARDIAAGVAGADVLLSLLTETITAAQLDAAPHLLGVANYAVGHDNLDLAAATRLGIPVSNTPDVLTESTADLTWALLLGAARRVVEADRFMRRGKYRRWGPELLLGHDVSTGADGRRRVLGIIGFGRIGQAVARRATGFDVDVVAFHPRGAEAVDADLARAVSLSELLATSDFVSLHVPLTPATHHLIGAAELQAMKPTAVLVNTARGPVVDEAALVAALRDGTIAAAGLDVYEHEPAMAEGLAELANTVLLPHIGSASGSTRDAMARIAARNAVAMLRAEPAPECINPEVYATAAFARRRDRVTA